MVNPGLTINLFEFQEKAVMKLIDATTKVDAKETVLMKAPTGSGKTIILIDYIDKYLSNVDKKTAFIWLCPGKGNLEEQSRDKMNKLSPGRNTQNLFDALTSGFSEESTTFINWELVTKKGNTAIRDSERKNLFDRIADAHRSGIEFIVIIDEEHSNNTAKAKSIIDAFAARHTIRVSATAVKNNRYEFFKIDELDVINAGLITKAIYVNEGIEENLNIDDDYNTLLDLADVKRKEISNRYKELNKNISSGCKSQPFNIFISMPLLKLKLLEIFLKSEFPDTVLNLHILFVAPLIYAISYALLSIAIISERDVSPSITWSKRECTTDFTCCINNSFMVLGFYN